MNFFLRHHHSGIPIKMKSSFSKGRFLTCMRLFIFFGNVWYSLLTKTTLFLQSQVGKANALMGMQHRYQLEEPARLMWCAPQFGWSEPQITISYGPCIGPLVLGLKNSFQTTPNMTNHWGKSLIFGQMCSFRLQESRKDPWPNLMCIIL